ncbi:hypothetical protein GF325_18170 [Candidatus Bathyarchaeota archaeon]|nr:hypothetical protein [Candidatus Bathyarchaeota archaeon]
MRHDIRREEWDRCFYKSREKPGQEKVINEPVEKEIEKVQIVLEELHEHDFIQEIRYSLDKFSAFRKQVKESFFVFWTAINPPMERLLYALSAILKPRSILGLGIFTGNPVVWSMGPALDGTYDAAQLDAVEIEKNNARLCRDNFKELESILQAKIHVNVHGEDGFKVLEKYGTHSIDLLYLDANGLDPETGIEGTKRINYTFLKRALPKLKPGSTVMCHNATMDSFKKEAGDYLELTGNDRFFTKTSGIHIDEMGLEVSIRR